MEFASRRGEKGTIGRSLARRGGGRRFWEVQVGARRVWRRKIGEEGWGACSAGEAPSDLAPGGRDLHGCGLGPLASVWLVPAPARVFLTSKSARKSR